MVGEVKASPNADTTILFVKGEGDLLFSDLNDCVICSPLTRVVVSF